MGNIELREPAVHVPRQAPELRRDSALTVLPGYFLYCLFHIVLLPYLLVNAARRLIQNPNRKYREGALARLLGGCRPPRKGRWVVIVGTGLGEARTALLAAEEIEETRHSDVAVWVKFGRVLRLADGANRPFPVGLAPYNNPVSALIALARWRPRAIIFVENADNLHLAVLARLLGVKTLLANVNISERRARRYSRRPLGVWRIRAAGPIATQGDKPSRRLAQIGVPADQILVSGPVMPEPVPDEEKSLKRKKWRQILSLDGSPTPVVVAGSTHKDEERAVLESFMEFRNGYPSALLILAPRYPFRKGGADSVLRETGTAFARRSQLNGELPASGVVLLDTEGELREVYSVATVAFVGGSLTPKPGGHTPVEPLAWGVPITIGPHYGQQEAVVSACADAGVLSVCSTPDELARSWAAWTDDDQARDELRRRSTRLMQRRREVFQTWYDLLFSVED
ncbi:MAG: hypothetical protein IH851_06075 [Armatimonadetes bacterium]|nr:hypothetical protein [Armatimonadota bacterium]